MKALLLILFLTLFLIICLITISVMTQKHYLNYNSTAAKEFNYSDMLYPENALDREHVEQLKAKVLRLLNAPVGSKCIILSGATEAIASCIKWASDYIPKGVIVGSSYDHSAIESNAKNFGMKYVKIDITKSPLPDNTAAVFISQVDSSTGEYQSVEDITDNIANEHYLIDGGDIPRDAERVLQYHPLIFLDATQSFMKLPIDMEKNNINAVFFSVHKLGGEQGLGFLVINEQKFPKFKPLIAGEQQEGLRGGTLPVQKLLEFPEIYDMVDNMYSRKDAWERTFRQFKEAGVNVYEPKGKHLYSTFLIDTGKKCSKGIISELANEGIYIGAKSACSLEGGNKPESIAEQGKNLIRISFRNADDIDERTVQRIIDEII